MVERATFIDHLSVRVEGCVWGHLLVFDIVSNIFTLDCALVVLFQLCPPIL